MNALSSASETVIALQSDKMGMRDDGCIGDFSRSIKRRNRLHENADVWRSRSVAPMRWHTPHCNRQPVEGLGPKVFRRAADKQDRSSIYFPLVAGLHAWPAPHCSTC